MEPIQATYPAGLARFGDPNWSGRDAEVDEAEVELALFGQRQSKMLCQIQTRTCLESKRLSGLDCTDALVCSDMMCCVPQKPVGTSIFPRRSGFQGQAA